MKYLLPIIILAVLIIGSFLIYVCVLKPRAEIKQYGYKKALLHKRDTVYILHSNLGNAQIRYRDKIGQWHLEIVQREELTPL